MTVSEPQIAKYFAPAKDAVWRWSDDGKAIVTLDGRTIAFREEIEAILTRLAPRGLPPLGAIVILLAATRELWTSGFRGALSLYGQQSEQKSGDHFVRVAWHVRQKIANEIRSTIAGLDRVHEARAGFLGIEWKTYLADGVFETSANLIRPPESTLLAQALARGLTRESLVPEPCEGFSDFLRAIDALHPLKNLASDQLILRRKTGLDQMPAPADADVSQQQQIRELIAALRNDKDPDLAGLARLAQNLIAAVHVPRTLKPDDELPLGGYTDISNRGPLDRLLISELAHDDLTLAVRVALNEALYLRREAPPRQPPERRAILIDSGIRMWGLPRLYAAAASLALAATAGERTQASVFRARGTDLVDVDVASRAGLVEHLAALETAPHPGAALKKFFDSAADAEHATERIIVTHGHVMADASFRAALASAIGTEVFVASVDGDGTFRFARVTPLGQTVLNELKLSLEQIQPAPVEPARPVPLRKKEVDPYLPLILSASKFPLRIPHQIDGNRARYSAKLGLICVTRDGRLTRWDESQRGPLQLSAEVPHGQLLKVLIAEDAEAVAVFHQQDKHAFAIHVTNVLKEESRAFEIPRRGTLPLDIQIYDQRLVFIYRHRIEAYRLSDGASVEWCVIPRGIEWNNGRYFKEDRKWHVLRFDGRMHLEDAKLISNHWIALIDLPGVEGPWGLTEDGTLVSSVNLKEVKPSKPLRVGKLLAVSDNGGAIVCECEGPQRFQMIDMKGTVAFAHGLWQAGLSFPRPNTNRFCLALRSRIDSVGITMSGIVKFFANGRRYRIKLTTNPAHEFLCVEPDGPDPQPLMPFTATPRPHGARYDLRVAHFADRSRVYLDSRGMMHFKSSDPSLPEITLVLHDPMVCGWSSDQEQFGGDYFLRADGAPKVSASRFIKKLQAFAQRLP
ncbi:MAG TPA: hypothetical protein VEJ63_14380 [Planctomycetota bacterium]|nr:hypothetical protein [Planctomycetota bacterium]